MNKFDKVIKVCILNTGLLVRKEFAEEKTIHMTPLLEYFYVGYSTCTSHQSDARDTATREQNTAQTNPDSFPASQESFLAYSALVSKPKPGSLKSAHRSLHQVQIQK